MVFPTSMTKHAVAPAVLDRCTYMYAAVCIRRALQEANSSPTLIKKNDITLKENNNNYVCIDPKIL